MGYAHYIKLLARRDVDALESVDAATLQTLFGAMFDGGVPDLELGALTLGLHQRVPSVPTFASAYRAMADRVQHLRPPDSPFRPLVLASHSSTRSAPNLLPWLALSLRRLGIPVLVHGNLGGAAACNTARVFRELGIMPSATAVTVEAALDSDGVAFAPTGILSPGLGNLMALHYRLGLHDGLSTLAALLDPFRGHALRVVGVRSPALRACVETLCGEQALDALVFEGVDDDANVDPCRRPGMVYFDEGVRHELFSTETAEVQCRVALPEPQDVDATVAWTTSALDGEVQLPHPQVNQLACCLYISGYAVDLNQAKAIATMESGVLLAGKRRRHEGTGLDPATAWRG